MTTKLRLFLIGLFLTCGLLACIDHRQRPLSPLNLRLKTVENENFSGLSTTFTYDQGNRVESYSFSNGSRGMVYYDDQGRYLRIEQSGQTDIRFIYTPGVNSFRAGFFSTSGIFETNFLNKFYNVDGDKRVLGFANDQTTGFESQTYEYTGNNITKLSITLGRNRTTRTFEYDDKPNPYYGVIGLGLTVDEFQTYNRNNVTKATFVGPDGTQVGVVEYVYEYNAQGLPTKVTRKDGTGEVRFTYESY